MLAQDTQKKKDKASESSQAYRDKHNYMDCPGDTNMPEYDGEEVRDIEESEMTQAQIAKKYNRSVAGVSDKKYRMGNTYKTPGQKKHNEYRRILKLKAADQWDFANNRPKPGAKITKIVVKTDEPQVIPKEVDDVINGDMSIDEFLNS